MPPIATDLTFVGVAKEATPGTSVAATNYLRVDKPQPQDKPTYLEDKGQRGAFGDVYNVVQGVTESEFSWGGPAFADEIGWALAGLHGDVVTSGAGPFTHNIAIHNTAQPKSLTLTDYDGVNARRYAGQQVAEFALKFNADGFLSYTAKSMGWMSAVGATPVFAQGSPTIIPSWLGTAAIAGSNSTIVESGEITVKRTAEVIHTVQNSQAPFAVFLGELAVDGKATVIMQDDTELTRFLAGTKCSMVFDWSQNAAAEEVKVTMTSCQYKIATINRGKQAMRLDITWKAINNTTDVGASAGWSPAKWLLKNQLAAATYQ